MGKREHSNLIVAGLRKISPQVRAAFFGALLFGLFCHGMALFNKLAHLDGIDYLFNYGLTVALGRWMLQVLCWLEGLFFGTGNAGLPLYNGLLSILCIGAVCALLVHLLKIKDPVYCALLGCLMVSFPMVTALFAYMFTSHPYMIGLLMMTVSAYLICRNTPWWLKIFGVLLGGASVGVYQAYIPVLLSIILIYDMMRLKGEIRTGQFLREAVIQLCCVAGVMLVYFAANQFFLHKYQMELSPYAGIDEMGTMSVVTYLERAGKAYSLFFCPVRYETADMYPGTLHSMYYLLLIATGILAIRLILLTAKRSRVNALLMGILFAMIPLGTNFIYVMSEDAHSLMVYGQAMLFVLLIALLDDLEGKAFKGRNVISVTASFVLAVTGVMYARYDNQCYLKDMLHQQEAISRNTVLISQMKSLEGYRPDMPVCFVNKWVDKDTTIYNLDEMDYIHLSMYDGDTSYYMYFSRGIFMRLWCGFDPVWVEEDEMKSLPEVKAMPPYPADGSIQIIQDVLVVKF